MHSYLIFSDPDLQVQQYKHERECNSIISQTREDKIFRLENLVDGILRAEEFMEDEFISLTHEHKVGNVSLIPLTRHVSYLHFSFTQFISRIELTASKGKI